MPKEITYTSEATDDYLKAIFELASEDRKAGTSEIARKLGVSAASVTGMLQKLASSAPPFVQYEKRRGAELTAHGERRALEVIRHHRLLESYLHHALGYRWDEVHEEAERLEHFISEALEARMAAHLGNPEFDPHGHPIPRKDGSIPVCDDLPLRQVPEGVNARISRVSDEDPALLRFLGQRGVHPRAVVQVVEHQPFEGSTMLRKDEGEPFAVSSQVAHRVWVQILGTQGSAQP